MNVPKLRFPEFRGAGEWEKISLNQVAKYCKQKNNFSELNRVLTNSAEYGILDQRDFFDKDIANQNNLDGYYIVKKGDYVYNPRISKTAPVGPISKNHIGDGVMSPLYTVFQFNDVNNGFYEHYFSTSYWHQYMRNVSSTGARHDRMAIANADFMGLPLPQTIAEEQQKIADCLSSLDELVTEQTQTLEAYKQHKKGLMQQLFPQTGETTPRLRFPEFRAMGEWEIKLLGSFCKVGDIDHKMPLSVTNGIPYIMTGDFFGINDIDFDNAKKISVYDYELLSRKIKPEFGDIIIARYASVGAVRYVETKMKFLVSYSCAIIKCNDFEAPKYLYYIFQSDAIQSRVSAETNASSQKNIGIDSIKKLSITLATPIEQQKIANCLSSLDDLITAQSQKIEMLKLHKKGLMQGLFPNPSEEAQP